MAEINGVDIHEILQKQKPQKIVYFRQSYGTPYFCPECLADQARVEFAGEHKKKHTYCWKCGQVLDWEI